MSTSQRWWERRGLMRDTARAATLALLASAALLPVWVVFGGRIGTDARGAVLDAEARVDAANGVAEDAWREMEKLRLQCSKY